MGVTLTPIVLMVVGIPGLIYVYIYIYIIIYIPGPSSRGAN